MTLSTFNTFVMVVVIAVAVIGMILVLATANRRNGRRRNPAVRTERAANRFPGLDPRAARRAAEAAGDDPTADEDVEPGGHVIRNGRS